jgi:hypothetical protein
MLFEDENSDLVSGWVESPTRERGQAASTLAGASGFRLHITAGYQGAAALD